MTFFRSVFMNFSNEKKRQNYSASIKCDALQSINKSNSPGYKARPMVRIYVLAACLLGSFGYAQAQTQTEYCVQTISGGSLPPQCFNTHAEAEAYLHSEENPTMRIGAAELEPDKFFWLSNGNMTTQYRVKPKAPELFFGDWFTAFSVGSTRNCGMYVPLGTTLV